MHFSIFYEIVRSLKIIHFKEIHLIIDQMKCRFVILNLLIARVIYIYKISTIEKNRCISNIEIYFYYCYN